MTLGPPLRALAWPLRGWRPLALAALLGCGGAGPSPAVHEPPEPGTSPIEEPIGPARRGSDPADEGLLPLDVAVLGSAVKVRPDGPVEGAAAAQLFAARNEFESFQVAVNARTQALRGLTVSLAGPLEGPGGATIPESHVTVYRVGYYEVQTPSDLEGAPGRWPDPLIPTVDPLFGEARAAFPVDVPRGENRVAWVDVLVPRDAPPGTYSGRLDVRAEGHLARVPVRLTVLALTLPSTTTLKSSFGLNDNFCQVMGVPGCSTDSGVRASVKQLFVRLALDNRITIAVPHTARITTGSVRPVDEFRRYSLPFVKGTAPTRLPGARLTTYRVNSHTDRDIAGWRAEVEAQGFGDIAFVYSCDEPHFFPVYGDLDGNWARCLDNLESDRALWPDAPRMVTTHIQSAERYGATGLFDILVLNVELLDGPPGTPWHEGDQRPLYDAFLADPSRRKELWLYTACGSHGCSRNDHPYSNGWAGYEIDAPASQTRAMAWLAFSYRASGTLYYDTALQLAHAWEDQYRSTGNGDGTLFYPGTPERIGGSRAVPLESVRMKLVRDGYEDYEYLSFLGRNGQGAEAHRIARALFPTAWRTSRSDAEVQAARRELATRVAAITGGPRP